MAITISKNTLNQIIFIICVGVPYLDNFELTFAVWSLSALFTLHRTYSVKFLTYILCFAIILALAFIVMFFHDRQAYYVIRDITYMFKPILGLMLGYQLLKNNYKNAFNVLVNAAVVVAVLHILILINAVIFHHAVTVNDLRLYGGYFSDYEVFALIVLLFHKKFELDLSRQKIFYFTILIALSACLYLARTNFIQFAILFVAMKGYLKVNTKSILVVISTVLLVVIAYSTIVYINPKRNGAGIEALLYKIKIAPVEAFKTKIDPTDWKDLNDNYRSYENIMTVEQLSKKGIFSVIFGEGLGSKIDLKVTMKLGDKDLRYISILHNGFMTVFLKTGLLGICIYIYTIYLLFKQNRSKFPVIQNINLLLVGTGTFLIFSNWVFMGLYNLRDNKALVIGLLFCFVEMYRKNNLLPVANVKPENEQ